MAKPKPTAIKRTRSRKQKTASGYARLVESIGGLIDAARQRVAQAVNTEMVRLYWEIGRHIVEYEQGGSDRAKYGQNLLHNLGQDLSARFGKGFRWRNLFNMRLLYLAFPILQALPAKLGWTHLLLILRVEEPLAREFYVKQCQRERWSTRELERQINSLLFERLALSRDKKGVLALAREGQQVQHPADLLRDPFVFEFLDLPEPASLSELELEARLVDRLQQFLLELGQGFCFIARQKRLTVGTDHFYIDLLFDHRILKCFVVIDLKMGAFMPADVGQMNFYLNYLKHEEGSPDDNPPVGILLCLDRNELYVRYAIEGVESQILTGRFRLSLPSAEQLKMAVQKVLEG